MLFYLIVVAAIYVVQRIITSGTVRNLLGKLKRTVEMDIEEDINEHEVIGITIGEVKATEGVVMEADGNYNRRGNYVKNESSGQDEEGICFMTNSKDIEHRDSNKLVFCIDSGCTDHLVNDKSFFSDFLVLKHPIKIAVAKNNNFMEAIGVGNIKVISKVNRNEVECTIKNVFYVPNLRKNLLSVKKLEMANIKLIFEKGQVSLYSNKKLIGIGYRNNLYEIEFEVEKKDCLNIELENEDVNLWHKRYGHICQANLDKLVKNGMVLGIDNLKVGKIEFCEPCIKGKMSRLPFGTRSKAKRLLEIVHSDVAGPITPLTHDGGKYFVSFIDDFSNFVTVYIIKNKGDVFSCFKEYAIMMQSKFDARISVLRSDNGREYISDEFKTFCRENGIYMDYTTPYTPEQNGKAERFNRSLVDKARAMIEDGNVPKTFWNEAVRVAAYLLNRSPSSQLSNTTPAELWYGKKPDVKNLRVFGSTAYSHIPKELRSKFDAKSEKCIMVGYTTTGYRLWSLEKQKIIVSRDVVFNEKNFHYKDTQTQVSLDRNEESADSINEEVVEENQVTEGKEIRKSTRVKKIPKRLEDYEINDNAEKLPDETIDIMMAYSIGFLSSNSPSTFEEAIQDKDWEKAIEQELMMLKRNETWEVVPFIENQDIIDSKWVFSEKEVQGRNVKKARLVARGFQQKTSAEEEIYTPVARMITLRVLLSLAVENNCKIHQMDVKSAFLHGELREPVYMYLPDGLEGNRSTHVCKLKKALYGLRSSPKCWYERLSNYLNNIGFRRSDVDPCLFVHNNTYLLIWVDDLILISNDLESVEHVKSQLSTEFDMKDFSNSNKITFLGLEIEKNNNCLYISQQNLIARVLKKFYMLECKSSYTPMQAKLNLELQPNIQLEVPYKELIGSLMYIMLGSRPDICFSVMYFSQFQNCFGITHWKHLRNILRYLNYTKNYALKYTKTNVDLNVEAYADSDFASNPNDRKSVTGFLLKLNNNTVAWKSKKQAIVALSSSESEYVALASCVAECLFLKQLLESMTNTKIDCINVYEDNQSSIKMASTLETKRSKHIDVKYHFLRNFVSNGTIKLVYLPTTEQCADLLTKALPRVKHEYFRGQLGVVSFKM
ncbi:hypothetical protein AMK59_6683 [Oryctes borbonicus]|uniref:Integrase catalytic domain-containing protein n=1 Tax=Oryctes borbonicus TaxID=1629725 RepID=A0A0T6AT79_9SCAR|nr:hypothetical protein AMK59_6683 [Oryctes borbonicus]